MRKTPRILLLVDWIPEKGSVLLESLRMNGIECDIMGINYHQSKWTPANKVLSHWPRCLWCSIKAFKLRNEYDYIIAWQQIMGMFLGLLKVLTFSDIPKVFILTAIIVERKNPALEWLRRRFIAVTWSKVNKIGFLSVEYMHQMRLRFRLPEEKSVLLISPIINRDIPDLAGFKSGSYLYSVGRSCRDYRTLMAAAKQSSHHFIVVSSDAALQGISIPDNVTVYRNAFGEMADELMKNAAAVIIPLEKSTCPSGELTLLEAMCFGKPVIVTKSLITEEYITNGWDGLLVPGGDPDAIVNAIDTLLINPDRATAMGQQARQTALKNHTMDIYSKNIINTIVNDI